MLTKLFAIAANTFVETIRQPIYGVVVGTTLLLMILNVGLAAFTLDDDDRLLAELGLSTLLLSGLFLSSFCATSVLTREIENKTVLTVISKPVGRITFLAGKYMGLLSALALAYYVCFLGFFFAMQHRVLQTSADPWHFPVLVFGFGSVLASCTYAGLRNYLTGKEFMTTVLAVGTPLMTLAAIGTCFFKREWELQRFLEGLPSSGMFGAAFLIFCAVVVLAAIALAVSSRLGQVMTLLVCIGVLLMGLTTDYVLSDVAQSSWLAKVLYNHIPNFSVFWVVEALNAGSEIPLGYFAACAAYSCLLALAALLVGTALFQQREVG